MPEELTQLFLVLALFPTFPMHLMFSLDSEAVTGLDGVPATTNRTAMRTTTAGITRVHPMVRSVVLGLVATGLKVSHQGQGNALRMDPWVNKHETVSITIDDGCEETVLGH